MIDLGWFIHMHAYLMSERSFSGDLVVNPRHCHGILPATFNSLQTFPFVLS